MVRASELGAGAVVAGGVAPLPAPSTCSAVLDRYESELTLRPCVAS
jgi:hypothetical protein